MKDGCGKPAQVELDVSLSCFNVFLVADVHRFSPVSRQRDANQTCRCEQQLSALRQTVLLRGKYQELSQHVTFKSLTLFTFLFCPPLRIITVPNFSMCLKYEKHVMNMIYISVQSVLDQIYMYCTLIMWWAALYAPVPLSLSPGACSPVS